MNRMPQNPRREWSRRDFLLASGALALTTGCGQPARPKRSDAVARVIVLGVDGMDPVLTQRFIAEGRMPNCQRLIERGSFAPLATSNPPQSPVAWSSFISGTNPGGHGIFDFIARDPQTMQLFHSTSRLEPGGSPVKIGKFLIPTAPAKLRNRRHGATLWDELQHQGVDCTVFRMPANFPPTETEATTLSGMGTPDLQGGYGTFTWFTDAATARTRDVSGGRFEVVQFREHAAECRLRGPANEFSADQKQAEVSFTVYRDPEQDAARIVFQDRTLILKAGEWSDWVVVKFSLLPYAVTASGICRLYLKSVHEPFGLYVSPINIDPSDPSLPLSTPPEYSKRLVRELGYFYTQGLVEDTHALTHGVLNASEYREQAMFVHDERMRFFEHELSRFRGGFLFFYFSTLDLSSHMFWRAIDPGHPLHSPKLAESQGDFIATLYEKIDRAVGLALERLDDQTWLVVMSDHGFCSFRRQFNLNSWLLDNGYLRTSGPPNRSSGAPFQGVDWKRSRAFGVGLNGLFLNREGREVHGPVKSAQVDELAHELATRLKEVRDPDTREPVIANVFRSSKVYSGPHLADAPDLIVGYHRHYRASWDTILGGFPRQHVLDNTDAWSGDHCVDPQFVPGVLLSNRALPQGTVRLEDLAPTILQAFQAPIPESMTGQPLHV